MHIFVIEDEPLIRRELKILLENALYQVTAPDTFDSVTRQALDARPDLAKVLGHPKNNPSVGA